MNVVYPFIVETYTYSAKVTQLFTVSCAGLEFGSVAVLYIDQLSFEGNMGSKGERDND